MRHDATVLLQPAKHAFDDVALPIFGAIKKSRQSWLGFALHASQRNDWLHAITITILAQRFSVVTLVSQQPAATLAWATAQAGYASLIE